MSANLHFRSLILLLCVCLAASGISAKADVKPYGAYDIGPSKSQVTGVIIAIVAVGAAIGIGTYLLVRKAPTVTGCALSGPNGLQLQNEGDQKTYVLIGDTAGITSGDRVRVKGRHKKDASGNRAFLVEDLKKDYGVCKVQPIPHN